MHMFGLMASIGMLLSLAIILKIAKYRPVSAIFIMQVYAALISIGFLFGWIFHVIVYQQISDVQDIAFGNSFLGSILGVTVSALLLVRTLHNESFLTALDVIAPAVAAFHSIAKTGCFFAGCCYGTECNLPWSVAIAGTSVALHPVQLYESAAIAAIGLFLFWLFRQKPPIGMIGAAYLSLYGLDRFLAEFVRADSVAYCGGLSISQYFAWPLFGTGLVLVNLASKSQTNLAPS